MSETRSLEDILGAVGIMLGCVGEERAEAMWAALDALDEIEPEKEKQDE